jgi:hypothetical protein
VPLGGLRGSDPLRNGHYEHVHDDVIGAHSASELLRVGVPRRQVISCLTDELDLTEDQAEMALAVADTPIDGVPVPRRRTKIRRRVDDDDVVDLRTS